MIRFNDGTEFDEVWTTDFEFIHPVGSNPEPVCLVAIELTKGHTIRLFQEELRCLKAAPYAVDSRSLFVSYYAIAELSCHLALGWPLPANVLDLYVEFRNRTNGLEVPAGRGLLGALVWFGLDSMDAVEKDAMRQLVMRGEPWTDRERVELLDYCQADTTALAKLFERMRPKLDIRRAILRGRFMKAAARMERAGVPMDVRSLEILRTHWESIQDHLIRAVDRDFGVYEGTSFRSKRFIDYLTKHGIPWPHLSSGKLALDDDTFHRMADLYPVIAPLRQLRVTLSQMRLAALVVGPDDRNRAMLSPFGTCTGRNTPSNTAFIFGPAVWLRSLIQPAPGYAVAYVDYQQQEFAIAAALSRDPAMIKAYVSGDSYLTFGKQAGAIPADGTKESHGPTRELFKACALAVQYGMREESLAQRIGRTIDEARDLLRLHSETYCRFWRWSNNCLDFAMTRNYLPTVFGWTLHLGPNVNPRTLRNYPMQANGAEMLRLACCLATERGVKVCAPVHDAVLIESPEKELDEAIAETQRAMSDASALVLDGFRLRSDARRIVYPDRYMDERGKQMWEICWQVIREIGARSAPK